MDRTQKILGLQSQDTMNISKPFQGHRIWMLLGNELLRPILNINITRLTKQKPQPGNFEKQAEWLHQDIHNSLVSKSLLRIRVPHEKAMATHSSTLAWKIPWMEKPGRLQSMGSRSRARLSNFTFTFHFHALEKEVATHSSILAWKIQRRGSLVGCHLWGRTESDRTEVIQQQQQTTRELLISIFK